MRSLTYRIGLKTPNHDRILDDIDTRFHVGLVARGAGTSAPAQAAQILGLSLVNERLGRVHDHAASVDVVWHEHAWPHGAIEEWHRDVSKYWNVVEKTEKHPLAHLARRVKLVVPMGLDQQHAKILARNVAYAMAEDLNTPVSAGLHRDNERWSDRRRGIKGKSYLIHILMPRRRSERNQIAHPRSGIFRELEQVKTGLAHWKRWREFTFLEIKRLAQEQEDENEWKREEREVKRDLKSIGMW